MVGWRCRADRVALFHSVHGAGDDSPGCPRPQVGPLSGHTLANQRARFRQHYACCALLLRGHQFGSTFRLIDAERQGGSFGVLRLGLAVRGGCRDTFPLSAPPRGTTYMLILFTGPPGQRGAARRGEVKGFGPRSAMLPYQPRHHRRHRPADATAILVGPWRGPGGALAASRR